ncbi:MAG: glycosyltransferase, partial [Ignavibacteriales bacterium]|nr:glycosyltransferase [Ignavibacteriales bacterium]
PWVDIAYYKGLKRNALTLFIDRYFEKTTLEAAEHIVFVTEFTKKDFVDKYPSIRDKSHVIYWGYDEDMFESLTGDSRKNEELVIVHAGNIFDFQNPAKLWATLKKMSDEGQKISIRFIGTVSPAVSRAIEENGLQEMTNYMGFLPYKEMLQQLSGADFLLVCPSEKRHIPGKLFEYLRIGKPILAIGEKNEEVAEILQKAQAGRFFSFDESPEAYLLNRTASNTNKNYIESFERKNLTKKLAAILQREK